MFQYACIGELLPIPFFTTLNLHMGLVSFRHYNAKKLQIATLRILYMINTIDLTEKEVEEVELLLFNVIVELQKG